MDNLKSMMIEHALNNLPHECPECDSKELYGCWDSEKGLPVAVCGRCGCLMYLKERKGKI